ncbi:hypothetical protein ACE1TF_08190 [Geomicrobium sp. JSM 1781026]|uniref:hypothetical protein n=1 Tax=Geomicrobium sp. JSM 1781026 TaxID=3344580 RepID=UPI0035C06A8B
MLRSNKVRHLILGTMKSSKSAHLIMNGHQLDEQGKRVLTLKPETDLRDGAFVSSRALHTKRPATVIPKYDDGTLLLSTIESFQPDVVLVDELQFFTDEQVEALSAASIAYDSTIQAYGLMISYTGMMFEPVKRAMECGFTIHHLSMPCVHCSQDATHHLLYLDGQLQTSGSPINVEDFGNASQVYESVCYECYSLTTNPSHERVQHSK